MIVYLDLVMILNFFVDYLLILGTNRLAGYPPGYSQAALAAALGGIYAGGCLVPGFSFLAAFHWRVTSLVLMSLIAFGWNRSALQRGAVFILLSMALGGLAMGAGGGSFGMLLLCALAMWLLCRISFRGSVGQRSYVPVELSWNDRTVSLIALRDTGNCLRDPLTGEQVLVAGADVGERLLGLTDHQLRHPVETVASGAVSGLRLIPYRAVGQPGSMLLALRIPKARIGNSEANPMVAFAPEELGRGDVYQMLTGGAG